MIKPGKAALVLLPYFPYLWSDAALFGAPSSAQKWLRKPIQEAHFAAGISGSWNPSSAKIRPSTMKGEVPVAYTLFLKPLSFNFNQGHALKIGPVFRGRIYDQPSLFTQGGVGAGFFYQHPFFECLFNPMAETPVPHSFDLSFRFPKLPRFLSGLQGVIHPQAFYAGEVEGKERSQLPIYPFSLAPVLSFGKHGFLRGIVNLSPETLFHQAIPSLEVTLGLKVSGENSSSLLLGLLPNSFLSPSGSPNLQAAASDAAQGDPCETLESTEAEAVLPDSTEGITKAPPSSAAEPPTVLSQPPALKSPEAASNGGSGNLPGVRALASPLTPIPRLSGVINPAAQPPQQPKNSVPGTGPHLIPKALPAPLLQEKQGGIFSTQMKENYNESKPKGCLRKGGEGNKLSQATEIKQNDASNSRFANLNDGSKGSSASQGHPEKKEGAHPSQTNPPVIGRSGSTIGINSKDVEVETGILGVIESDNGAYKQGKPASTSSQDLSRRTSLASTNLLTNSYPSRSEYEFSAGGFYQIPFKPGPGSSPDYIAINSKATSNEISEGSAAVSPARANAPSPTTSAPTSTPEHGFTAVDSTKIMDTLQQLELDREVSVSSVSLVSSSSSSFYSAKLVDVSQNPTDEPFSSTMSSLRLPPLYSALGGGACIREHTDLSHIAFEAPIPKFPIGRPSSDFRFSSRDSSVSTKPNRPFQSGSLKSESSASTSPLSSPMAPSGPIREPKVLGNAGGENGETKQKKGKLTAQKALAEPYNPIGSNALQGSLRKRACQGEVQKALKKPRMQSSFGSEPSLKPEALRPSLGQLDVVKEALQTEGVSCKVNEGSHFLQKHVGGTGSGISDGVAGPPIKAGGVPSKYSNR